MEINHQKLEADIIAFHVYGMYTVLGGEKVFLVA
jgi:hypothetical protein